MSLPRTPPSGPLERCHHRLAISSGSLRCVRELGHGGPHEASVTNDVGTDGARTYRAAATVVWHETRERV